MEEGRPTDRMHELIEQIRKALGELDRGQLDLDGVDRTTEQARSLYERLVVLRHKAREVRVVPPTPPVAEPSPPPPPVEMPPMRLDTRPSEVTPRQTSLIDAIAETETAPAPHPPPAAPTPKQAAPRADRPAETPAPKKAPETPKPAAKSASLADKLEKGPIADLHKAIALSQKFWFVAELFQGQRDRYEKSIDKLNGLASAEDARTFVDKEIVAALGKAPDADALRSFLELVERRYL